VVGSFSAFFSSDSLAVLAFGFAALGSAVFAGLAAGAAAPLVFGVRLVVSLIFGFLTESDLAGVCTTVSYLVDGQVPHETYLCNVLGLSLLG
jgi:hypothetical protein